MQPEMTRSLLMPTSEVAVALGTAHRGAHPCVVHHPVESAQQDQCHEQDNDLVAREMVRPPKCSWVTGKMVGNGLGFARNNFLSGDLEQQRDAGMAVIRTVRSSGCGRGR